MLNKWRSIYFHPHTFPKPDIYHWILGLIIFGLAFFVRYQFVGKSPDFDEYYHLLAARSWAENGTFTILEGEYTRGYFYTILVGWFFSMFNESIEIARLPSLLAGSLNVLVVFLFVSRNAGITAALITSLFFIFDPVAVDLSTQVRFYAIQGLLFWIVAVLVFYSTHPAISIHLRLGMILTILPILALAAHLQRITLIGVTGFAVWIFIEHGKKIIGIVRHSLKTRTVWVVVIGLTFFSIIYMFKGDIHDIWERYLSAPGWLQEKKHQTLYYPYQLLKQYPLFWSFFPIAVLLVIKSHKRIVVYCLVMFATLLLLHSFAGSKHPRYFNYALPFLFIIWGIFLAQIFRFFRDSLLEIIPVRTGAYRQVSINMVAIMLFSYSILSLNVANYYQMTKNFQKSLDSQGRWIYAEPLLKKLADQVDIVLVTASNRAIYHIGRYDYAISPSQVRETESEREFGRDPRSGRYAIGTVQSIKLILDCTESGLFVSAKNRWKNAIYGIDNEGVDILLENTNEVKIPDEWGLVIRSWKSQKNNHADKCKNLPVR